MAKKEVKKFKRPAVVYDVNILMNEMLEWSKEEDSLSLAQFCSERGYTSKLIFSLVDQDEEFEDAVEITKMRLAARRDVMLNHDLLHFKAWDRYQRSLDPFLALHEKQIADEDAERKRGLVNTDQMNLSTLVKLISEGKIGHNESS